MMRMKPPVTVDEAFDWLQEQAARTWPDEVGLRMATEVQRIAVAMAAISAADIPPEIEPLPLSLSYRSWPERT
jgi:hypothetical protein